MNTPQEFAALLAALSTLRAGAFAGGAALATLVRTRGPVFRRPGARMLVGGDGSVALGLSAGCPEADIVGRAHEVIASGHARLLRYDRDHGFDALMEMGCGGELEVLIEPLRGTADLRFVDAVAQCVKARRGGVLATAFAHDGHCLPQPRRLVWSERVLLDELDDPRLTDAVLSLASDPAAPADVRVIQIGTRTGMLDVLFERLQPPLAAVLIGINATSLALARLAGSLGWQVSLVDHREDGAAPPGVDLIRAAPQAVSQRIALDSRTVAVVMTHNLERDIAYLQALRAAPLAYLGALGSRARATTMRETTGLSRTRLHAPAGLDIGSETPEEIALAVAAEIQAVVARRSGGALSASDGPIH